MEPQASKPINADASSIPILAEELQVGKRQVQTNRIRLTKQVNEREVPISMDLIQEETIVERVPINQPVDEAPAVRQEGDTLIIPVLREEYVVVKQLILVEEVRVSKQQTSTTLHDTVTLRHEELHIEDVQPESSSTDSHS